jgi:hypothetical protein
MDLKVEGSEKGGVGTWLCKQGPLPSRTSPLVVRELLTASLGRTAQPEGSNTTIL